MLPNSKTTRPLLALTMGDVNGVGPEILVKALANAEFRKYCNVVALGSIEAYHAARLEVGCGVAPVKVETPEEALALSEGIAVLECSASPPKRRPGVLDADAGRAAMMWLDAAIQYAVAGRVGGIVTCPIHKEGIRRAGFKACGHTDFIAERTDASDYRMCLFTDTMRIVHVSGHVSLRQALDQVRQARIVDSIRIGHDAMTRLGLKRKRIAVAGLNPHAGEAGRFGDEEKNEIAPAIDVCRAEGIACSGPYPADTIFKRMHEGEFDMVVAMYHDQGHIPLKLIAMDEGVNVTLGIPIVRTSVDHGTAFDIAGKGTAREHSLIAAMRLAARLCNSEVRVP
ncbi:MAG: 4-hydroxythreonine-4-phosphate dehydrogenase PdxA [Candidatus Hydrogenedentes bacterium]|nr:4-hydroxythreonine-4-phosphate dehydrogenase PdxA [Candidatus Hydrogenedentota bacterium]